MNPDRILIVTQHFWPESFRVNDLAAGFIERGWQVDVLCGLPNYPRGEWFSGYRYTGPRRETHDGVNIIRTGEIRRKGNTGARIFLNYVSWRERRFIYEDQLLGEVMEDLGRWYNVEVFIANPEVYDYHLTANLPKYEDMNKVLEIIEYAAGVQFEVNNRTVVIRSDR